MRILTNIQRWPRTFALVCGSYAVTAVGIYIGIRYHQVLSVIVSISILGVCDLAGYIWFMRDAYRVHLLLALLDNFEGREPADDRERMIAEASRTIETCTKITENWNEGEEQNEIAN